jgi:hypothetical protein
MCFKSVVTLKKIDSKEMGRRERRGYKLGSFEEFIMCA